MADYGEPRSFLDVDEGVDVVTADGQRIGTLTHVLADDATGIFDGIIIDVRTGPGGHRFVDAPEVAELRERAVVLTLDAAGVQRLPAPTENPAVVQHGGAEDASGGLQGKLRRAWDLLSGRY
jgi:hypothetical protein